MEGGCKKGGTKRKEEETVLQLVVTKRGRKKNGQVYLHDCLSFMHRI